jgi:WD40 repeat protein
MDPFQEARCDELRPTYRRRWLLLALAPLLIVLAWLTTWQRNPIWHIAFSPDGKLLATASGTPGRRTAQVWDAATGAELWAIDSPVNVFNVAFSPDGKTLATGNFDGRVELWEVATGTKKLSIAATTSSIVALAFAPDGKSVICVGMTGVVKRCDLATAEATTVGTAARPGVVMISRDAKKLAIAEADAGGKGGETIVYDLKAASLEPILHLPGYRSALAFSPDGKLLAAADSTAAVELWDFTSGAIAATIPARGVTALDFSADGSELASAGRWGNVQLWDVATGTHLWGFIASQGDQLPDIRLPGDTIAAASGRGGQIHVWNIKSPDEQLVLPRNHGVGIVFIVWLIAFVVWTVAWVRAGLATRRAYAPLVDVLLINGLIAAALTARVVTTGRPHDMGRPAVAAGLGLLAGLVSLVVIWVVLGRSRWQWRLPALVMGWALVWAVPIAVCDARNYGPGPAWEVTIGFGVTVITLITALYTFRAWGLRLTEAAGSADDAKIDTRAPRQFFLKDIILWMAAAAVFFGVVRHVAPRLQSMVSTSFEATAGASLAITALAALWAARSSRTLVLQLIVLLAVAIASGSTTEFFRRSLGLHPWWFYVTINVTEALCVALSLSVFRLYGRQPAAAAHPSNIELKEA